MVKKNRINPSNDINQRNEATKEYMIGYVENRCNEDEQQWFYDLCQSNKDKDYTKGGKTIKCYNWAKIRKEFITKFFPQLNPMNELENRLSQFNHRETKEKTE